MYQSITSVNLLVINQIPTDCYGTKSLQKWINNSSKWRNRVNLWTICCSKFPFKKWTKGPRIQSTYNDWFSMFRKQNHSLWKTIAFVSTLQWSAQFGHMPTNHNKKNKQRQEEEGRYEYNQCYRLRTNIQRWHLDNGSIKITTTTTTQQQDYKKQ